VLTMGTSTELCGQHGSAPGDIGHNFSRSCRSPRGGGIRRIESVTVGRARLGCSRWNRTGSHPTSAPTRSSERGERRALEKELGADSNRRWASQGEILRAGGHEKGAKVLAATLEGADARPCGDLTGSRTGSSPPDRARPVADGKVS